MEAHPPGSVTARRACDQPAPEYERARQLLAQGRLHRTLRVLEVANKRCVSSRHHGWATEVEALARVGRHQAARELAQQILHSNGNPLAKKAAHAALDLVKRRTAPARAPQQMLAESQRQLESGQRLLRQAEHLAQRGDAAAAGTLYAKAKAAYEAAWLAQPPNGQGLFLAGHCALKQGRAVEAQRLFDRALLELERDAGKPVKLHTRRNQVEKYISSTKLIAWSARDDQLAVAEKNLVQLVSPDKPGRLSLLTAARVRDLLFTSDGSFIVTASDGGQLELWSALDGTLLWSTLTRRSPIAGVALTPDGRGILIASVDGRVQIRNVLDGNQLPGLGKDAPEAWGAGGGLVDLAVSRNRKLLALAGANHLYLWDLEAKRQLGVVGPHDRPPRSVALSDDGELVASTALDGKTRVWRWRAETLLQQLPGNDLFDTSVRFLPGSKSILVTSATRLRYWEPTSGRLLKVFGEAHRGEMAFSPNADAVATVADANVVSIWNAGTGKLERRLKLRPEGKQDPLEARFCRVGIRSFAFELCAERESTVE